MPAQDHAQWRAGQNKWKGRTAVPCRSASFGEFDSPDRIPDPRTPECLSAFLNEPKVREAKSIICETGGRAATAKYAAAIVLGPMADNGSPFFRISLACRSSRTSRSSSLIRAFSALVWPGRSPPSRWPWRTHTKAVRRTPQFACDRRQRCGFALILIAVFHNQPHRRFAELGGIPLRGLLLLCLFHNGQFPESFALR